MAERTAQRNNHHNDNNGEDEGLFVEEEESNKENNECIQIAASPKVTHATYIVQIPRDQIYRVPPPENAEYVKLFRDSVHNTQSGGRRCRCTTWFLLILFGLAFIISVIVCVHEFTLSPKPPSFSVKHLLLIKHSSKNTTSPVFQASMETSNPNSVNEVRYKEGSVRLSYKGKQLGKGHFPALDKQAPGKFDTVKITVSGSSKGGLPKDLDKSKGNKTYNMILSINVPIYLKTWLWTNSADLDVNCAFEVQSMGDHFQIQSQKCDVHK